MANPITAIASRSCAKNSMLKQAGTTEEKKDDITTSGTTKEVSTTTDVQQNIGGGRAAVGDQTDTTITSPGSEGGTETIYDTGKSLEGLTPEQLAWRENEIKKLGGIDEYHKKYGDPKKGKARQIDTPGTPPTETKTSDFEVDQEQVKGQENFDLRQDIRQEKALNRLDRQAERREDRFQRKYNPDGTKRTREQRKKMRKDQRAAKAKSNIQRQKNVQNLIADRRALRDLQRDQGSFGGEQYYVSKTRENLPGQTSRVTNQSNASNGIVDSAPDTSGIKTTTSSIIDGVGSLFAKKPGGTFVGNLLRGGKSPAPMKKNYFNS